MDSLMRLCEENELEALLNFAKKSFVLTFEHMNDPGHFRVYLREAFHLAKWRQEWQNPKSEFYIHTVDGQIDGYVKLNFGEAQTEILHENAMEIERIYVDPSIQGRGLGKEMLGFCENKARLAGKDTIWLGVWEKNVSAIRFYERNGFKHIGEHDFYIGNDKQIDWIMSKSINRNDTVKTRKFGLIGYPLTHSFSPSYFKGKFEELGISDCQYDLYPLAEIKELEMLLDGDIRGLNVTIPYKEQVLAFLSELSPEAKEIGAVNTISIEGSERIGYNTDSYGFEQSLLRFCGDKLPSSALVLGTGGASKAVVYVLQKLGVSCQLVSRSGKTLMYSQITENLIQSHLLIVNTTPLGMSKWEGSKPDIPYHLITPKHYLYDLIYNPEKTLFLAAGEKMGARIKNGLEMLQLQADRSWQIWNESKQNRSNI